MFIALRFTARAQPPVDADVRIEPRMDTVQVYTNFIVDVNIYDFYQFPVFDYEFNLFYDPTQMTPINAWDGGFLQQPVSFSWSIVAPGQLFIQCWTLTTLGSTGSGTLASIEFHCDEAGDSGMSTEQVLLSDEIGQQFVVVPLPMPVMIHQWEVPPAYVWLEPPTYTVPICVPFKVNVMIKGVVDLYSFQLTLSYTNTAVVDCIDIADGGFLLPPTTVTHKLIDDSIGLIEFDLSSTIGGVDGTGTLATITFHCTGAGDSFLSIDKCWLYDSTGLAINRIVGPASRVIQKAYWEPVKLIDIVELPYPYWMTDIPFVPPGSPEGYLEIKTELEAKGFIFDPEIGGSAFNVESFFDVYYEPGTEPFEGTVTSWWSANTLNDGTRACLLSAEWEDPTLGDMAMGFVTNLLPPEQVPEVDPYIIVNAQPYIFVRFYYWAPFPIARIVAWSYWWYDSHSHPNWFWGLYWWWRTYTKAYYYPYTDVPYWQPWWGWWWHWTYWKHWHWWSTYFPYDP